MMIRSGLAFRSRQLARFAALPGRSCRFSEAAATPPLAANPPELRDNFNKKPSGARRPRKPKNKKTVPAPGAVAVPAAAFASLNLTDLQSQVAEMSKAVQQLTLQKQVADLSTAVTQFAQQTGSPAAATQIAQQTGSSTLGLNVKEDATNPEKPERPKFEPKLFQGRLCKRVRRAQLLHTFSAYLEEEIKKFSASSEASEVDTPSEESAATEEAAEGTEATPTPEKDKNTELKKLKRIQKRLPKPVSPEDLRAAIHRAITAGYATLPHQYPGAPYGFKVFLNGSKAAQQMTEIATRSYYLKNKDSPEADKDLEDAMGGKRLKWGNMPAYVVVTMKYFEDEKHDESGVNGDQEGAITEEVVVSDDPNDHTVEGAESSSSDDGSEGEEEVVSKEKAAGLSSDDGSEGKEEVALKEEAVERKVVELDMDDESLFTPVPLEGFENAREQRQYCAAIAAVQNIRLSLLAEQPHKLVPEIEFSGDLLGMPALHKIVGTDKVVALISIGQSRENRNPFFNYGKVPKRFMDIEELE